MHPVKNSDKFILPQKSTVQVRETFHLENRFKQEKNRKSLNH